MPCFRVAVPDVAAARERSAPRDPRDLVAEYCARAQDLRRLLVFQLGQLLAGLLEQAFESDGPPLSPQDVGQAEGEGAVAGGAVPILVGEFVLLARFDDH